MNTSKPLRVFLILAVALLGLLPGLLTAAYQDWSARGQYEPVRWYLCGVVNAWRVK